MPVSLKRYETWNSYVSTSMSIGTVKITMAPTCRDDYSRNEVWLASALPHCNHQGKGETVQTKRITDVMAMSVGQVR